MLIRIQNRPGHSTRISATCIDKVDLVNGNLKLTRLKECDGTRGRVPSHSFNRPSFLAFGLNDIPWCEGKATEFLLILGFAQFLDSGYAHFVVVVTTDPVYHCGLESV